MLKTSDALFEPHRAEAMFALLQLAPLLAAPEEDEDEDEDGEEDEDEDEEEDGEEDEDEDDDE